MPFTLAHPAAILPFKRYVKGANLSALVIGSMAPDFAYFVELNMPRGFSHSVAGLVFYCLPASLVVYLIFHLVLKRPLRLLLPDVIRSRLEPASSAWLPKTPKAFLILIASIIAGAATHLLWDSFTHRNTPVVQGMDWLRLVVSLGEGRSVPVYKMLQHLSSLLGLWMIAVSIRKWTAKTPPSDTGADMDAELRPVQRTAVIALLCAVGLSGILAAAIFGSVVSIERAAFLGIVQGVRWLAVATLLYCLAMQLIIQIREKTV